MGTEHEENNGFQTMLDRMLKNGSITKDNYDTLLQRLDRAQVKAEEWERKKAQQEAQLKAQQEAKRQAEYQQELQRQRSRQEEQRRKQEEARALLQKQIETKRKEAEQKARREEQAKEAQRKKLEALRSMTVPPNYVNPYSLLQGASASPVSDVQEALYGSLNDLGRVDVEYISYITGLELKEVLHSLKGKIYQDPAAWDECFYKGWETAEAYLSGNIRRKWAQAMEANHCYFGFFEENVRALQECMPPSVTTEDVYVTIGSPWVPTDIVDDFIRHLFRIPGHCYCQTLHHPETGTWEITNKPLYKQRIASRSTYGTERMNLLNILERTLNMKTISVMDELPDAGNRSGKKRVLNRSETTAALEKQQKILEEFQAWVWQDERRKSRLLGIYQERYADLRPRRYDGSYLNFPNLSEQVSLYPYQKNAVARIIHSPGTLLAHDVGSGKTYIMVVAGMERRRLGLSKKNLYVVPNNLIGQWRDIFHLLYPQAKLLCVDPDSFSPKKRQAVLEQIRDEDYDGILMAYSSFELIPLSCQHVLGRMEKEKARLCNDLRHNVLATSGLRRRIKMLEKKIAKAVEEADLEEEGIFFEDLGITGLFVDEAHNFKNVPLETQTSGVPGINAAGSGKCRDMLDKIRVVQSKPNSVVVLATGTPITNSVTDAYVMQNYLCESELRSMGLSSFDGWVGMFAQRVTEFEIDVDTSGYRLATRFAKFHNLPELTALLGTMSDFHQVDLRDGIPQLEGYEDHSLERTAEFEAYLQDISQRAELVRQGKVDRTVDNMLKITTDGRKAALDMRLLKEDSTHGELSKARSCAEQILEIYYETMDRKSTQLVFCDSSIPKKSFNLYDELRRLLEAGGIPSEQIAYIHDANTDVRREKLFAKVRKGQIRVLIGSTFKLGLGVNVQERLIALHHLDVPWRPADMTQREGRILRQGNENTSVRIFRYITEGSFDAYSWQLLETKQRFIVGLLSGSWEARSGEDIEDTILNYAEVKALAIGSPLIKRRVELCNEIARLLTLQRKSAENRIFLQGEASLLPPKLRRQQELIDFCMEDLQTLQNGKTKSRDRKTLRQYLYGAVQEHKEAQGERILTQYRGFDILLPERMNPDKPHVFVCGRGKYPVELGNVEISYLSRIDHVLDALPQHLEKLRQTMEELERRQNAIDTELQRSDEYDRKLKACRRELLQVDEELGLDREVESGR